MTLFKTKQHLTNIYQKKILSSKSIKNIPIKNKILTQNIKSIPQKLNKYKYSPTFQLNSKIITNPLNSIIPQNLYKIQI